MSASSVRHLTVGERAERGKHARARVPRERHAEWEPAPSRSNPVSWLEEQALTRVPSLVPIRHGRMLASPFAFFRGGALLMASDLATTPVSGLTVQACGDAHVANFGLYGSPERKLVFDLNDFDETHPAPWEWDVKRMLTSVAIAGRARGFSASQRRSAVRAGAGMYRLAMRDLATQGYLDVWYQRGEAERGLPRMASMLDKESLRQLTKVVEKALTKDNRQALKRLTRMGDDGELRMISDPPLIEPAEDFLDPAEVPAFSEVLHDVLRQARRTLSGDRRYLLEQYRFVHLARKVVGVGSIGTRTYVILMTGRTDDDVLLLQAKEAEASVLERFTAAGRHANHGHRVVDGQRLMQAVSDIFLGYARVKVGSDGRSHDFYLRQLRDWKGSWDPETMNPVGLRAYAQLCGWTLARAHARAGDPVAMSAYLGRSDAFDKAVSAFAESYADQNEADFAVLGDAVGSGRLAAQVGV